MSNRPAAGRLVALGLTVSLLGLPVTIPAQSAKPNYLPFTEFTAADTQAQVDLKKAYNDAVERYNQVLYDYYATLEQHDRLVDLYAGSTDPAERQRAKTEAIPLRTKLAALKRDAASAFAAVDQAARRAQAAGVAIRPSGG
jgi:hypothetical protein